jgi:hypothetical protein
VDMCWFCGRMYEDSQEAFEIWVSQVGWMEAEYPAFD